MRRLMAATSVARLCRSPRLPRPPRRRSRPAQREATHAMFEHVIDIPTVIGRHKVPEMAQYVADQFKAAGFPDGRRSRHALSHGQRDHG